VVQSQLKRSTGVHSVLSAVYITHWFHPADVQLHKWLARMQGGEGLSGHPPPPNFVKCLIFPWFLGISGKNRTFIKNLDTYVKPFWGDFTACNYPFKSLPNY